MANRKEKTMSMLKKVNIIFYIILLISALTLPALATPKVAIVLGGGAARGFSHIGLLKSLEEQGIPIDLLVGTSIGSIIASLYASGYSTDNLQQIVSSLNMGDLVELNVPPKGGLIDSGRLQHYLNSLLEQKTFEQLSMPFYSVMTNLRTGEEVALNEGLVSLGVQASMSIPGLFPPIPIGENFYIDGGLKNAVPANVAYDQGADVIIAVDVTRDLDKVNYDNPLTNIELAFLLLIDGYVENNTEMAHVLISPEVGYTSYMHFEQVEYLIEQGYKAGLAHMNQIKNAILEQDPNFEFIPYISKGFSEEEVKRRTKNATKGALKLPRPLTLIPEITVDSLNEFTKVAISIGHGPLSLFNFGYAYGFHDEMGGHELFIRRSKRSMMGEFGVFMRKPAENNLLWGAYSETPMGKSSSFGTTYLSAGPISWQLAAKTEGIFKSKMITVDLGGKLTKKRDLTESYEISMVPSVQIHPFQNPFRLWETGLVYPYLYGTLEMGTSLTKLEKRLAYEVGLGGQFKLFGLYPFKMSVGIQTKPEQKPSLMLNIVGKDF